MVLNIAKLVVVVAFSLVWGLIYEFTNRHGSDPANVIRLTRPVDLYSGIIQPWTALIYVIGGVLLPLLPLIYNWSWPRLRLVLISYATASILAFSCYWIWPLGMIRPEMAGDGLGERLMRGVFVVDKEANCFPSSHVFFAILGALLVTTGGAPRWVSVATWILAIAVCCTTVTTGQHYFIDAAGGLAVALLGFGVARWLTPSALSNQLTPARSTTTTA